MTLEEILAKVRTGKTRPGEDELRRLPYHKAFIYGRVSSRGQVEESQESIRELAILLQLAIEDGYRTGLEPEQVLVWLEAIQSGNASSRVMEEGEVVIDCRDLGLSWAFRENKRPGLAHLRQRLEAEEIGAIYLTEGMSRLSRDEEMVLGYELLSLLKRHSCRVRTIDSILNPAIPRDWEVLADDVADSADEKKKMGTRLRRRLALKASQGKHVGNPVTPGFIAPILGHRRDGSFMFGKWELYPPHQEVVLTVLQRYVRHRGSTATVLALAEAGVTFPPFPKDLKYMESRTALKDCRRTAEGGYVISVGVVQHLVTDLKLIGVWDWGSNLIPDNHPAVVPVELFLQACEIATSPKPKGRAVRHEPSEWAGLLWCHNHQVPRKVSCYGGACRWVCQPDYALGERHRCLDLIQRVINRPLTEEFLRCLDFTPYTEAVFDRLQADAAKAGHEEAWRKREESRLRTRLANLETYLGSSDAELEESYQREIKNAKTQLKALENRPPPPPLVVGDVERVRNFLKNLDREWHSHPSRLRNLLLRQVVDRVELRHRPGVYEATVIWKAGFRQVIEIQWPGGRMSRERKWQPEEDNLLRMLWPSSSQEVVKAAFPERSWSAIAQKACRLGLRRPWHRDGHPAGPRWTEEEEELLRKLYPSSVPVSEIAATLGRERRAVVYRASHLGVRRPPSIAHKAEEPVWEVKNINVLHGEPARCHPAP